MEEISGRINKLIDSESLFDLNRAGKSFRGFCNSYKFDMEYPNLSRVNHYTPRYSIKGTITDSGNTREVCFLIRNCFGSYLYIFLLILILIISLFTGSESAIMQLIYWLSSLLAYVMYLRFSMKKNKKLKIKYQNY